MATWAKQKLPRENGELVDMQVPILVSASRSTDIPAFYADWFFYRLDKAGYSAWTNPFNGGKKLCVLQEHTVYCVLVEESTPIVTISADIRKAWHQVLHTILAKRL